MIYSQEDLTRWNYNAYDVIYTLEIANVLQSLLEINGEKLKQFYNFQMFEIAPALIDIMNYGIKIDLEKKEKLYQQLTLLIKDVELKLEYLIGEPFNPKSQPQIKAVFKDLCGITPIIDKKTKAESFASASMFIYREQYPEYRALIDLILEYRSIGVFLRTFVNAKIDEDGRMRTSYNCAGTKTYRLSSRKNAFGNGANLANIPSKGKIDLKYSLSTIEEDEVVEEDESFISGDYEGITELPNCKEFFIPDTGFKFFNADYSGADAMIVAWDSDCKWLKNFFLTSEQKLYVYIGSHYLQREITTKDKEYKVYKQFIHGCVTGEHEVLTPDGWVKLDTFDYKTQELAVWDSKTQNIWFEYAKDFNKDYVEAEEDLYSIEGSSLSFLGTQDHKFPYMLSSGKFSKSEVVNLNATARIPYSGYFIGGSFNSVWAARLVIAIQADGHIQYLDSYGNITINFHFHKERKKERLLFILNKLNISNYNISEDTTRIWFKTNIFDSNVKYAGWWMLNYSKECIEAIVDELRYWDGNISESYQHKRVEISTTDSLAAEVYQTLIHLSGKGSKVVKLNRDITRKPLYRISINNRKFYRTETGTRGLVKHNGTMVYCPQTSTSFFLVRRNGNIYITGNTNYGMMEAKAAANANMPLHEAKKLRQWYFNLCPEIPDWHRRIASDIKTKGYIENIFGARGWFLNKESPTILNQAYAWLPQSSIAILVNKGLVNIHTKESKKDIVVLMQVHDALAGQYSIADKEAEKRIKEHMSVVLPYKDKLVIPVDFSYSEKSYGGCK